jgi:hypothetical protein
MQGEEEIGFAVARRRLDGWEGELYPSHQHWGESATRDLLSAMARHFGGPMRRLTLTQTHADALGASWPASLHFQRRRDQERHIVLLQRD